MSIWIDHRETLIVMHFSRVVMHIIRIVMHFSRVVMHISRGREHYHLCNAQIAPKATGGRQLLF